MSLTLKKSLIAASLALVAAGLCSAPAAMAAQKKVTAKKAAAKKKAEPKEDEDSGPSEADAGDTITTDYHCEMGSVLTIFQHEGDDSHIALRWKKRIHRLEKVGTTTGAQRYQNTTFGLIWIGIPSKGMLLDAKLNRQLANECKNADQEKGDVAVKPVVKSTEVPSTKVIEKVEPIVPKDPNPLPLPVPAAPANPAPMTPAPQSAPAATTAVPATPAVPAVPATPAASSVPAVPAAPATPAVVPSADAVPVPATTPIVTPLVPPAETPAPASTPAVVEPKPN